jgi:hypothetical protein
MAHVVGEVRRIAFLLWLVWWFQHMFPSVFKVTEGAEEMPEKAQQNKAKLLWLTFEETERGGA